MDTDILFTPADAQALWGLSPREYDTFRNRNLLHQTTRKAGRLTYTSFDPVQMAQFGAQVELGKQFGLPPSYAKLLAAEAAVEFRKIFLTPAGTKIPDILFAVVTADPPRWFRVDLNSKLSDIEAKAGGDPWFPFDCTDLLRRTCEAWVDKTGKRKEFEITEKRRQALKG